VKYLQLTPEDDLSVYRSAARSMGFDDLATYEQPLDARFREFTASTGRLHQMDPVTPPLSDVEPALRSLYDSGCSDVYGYKDRLRKKYGVGCPYCGEHCTTSQLDHYLPRSRYGEYSLFSPNLVPACVSCNQRFGDRVATEMDFIYPFGDDFLKDPVLRAYFDWDVSPFTVKLTVDARVTGITRARVERHVKLMNLVERFVVASSDELVRYNRLLHDRSDADIVHWLTKQADSYLPTPGPNAWPAIIAQAALSDARMMSWIRGSEQ
jgi:hypothetical protein